MKSLVRARFIPAMVGLLITFQLIGVAQEISYIPYQPDYSKKLNNVRDIYRDSLGFIWLSTNYGIIRIDGKNAVRLTKFNNPIIKSNSMLRMIRIPSLSKYYFHDELGNILSPDGRGGLESTAASIEFLTKKTGAHIDFNVLRQKAEFQILDTGECIAVEFSGDLKFFSHKKALWNNGSAASQVKDRSLVYLSGEIFSSIKGIIGVVTRSGLNQISISGLPPETSKDLEIFSDNEGNGFLISKGQLYRCHYRQKTLAAEPLKGIYGLSDVSAVLEDPSTGFIYIGSRSRDLQIYQTRKFENILLQSDESYEPSYYYSPLVLHRGEYLFASNDNLYKWSTSEQNQILQGINMVAVWPDSLNGIWFSSGDRLLNRLQLGSYPLKAEFVSKLDGEVRQIGMTGNQFFVLTNQSLYVFKSVIQRPLQIVRQFMLFDKLGPSTRTSQVYFLNDRIALVAHRDGLLKLDLKSGVVKGVEDLNGINVRNLTNVAGLGILAGSYGDGYFLIRGDRIIKMPMDEDGVMEAIHAFIADEFGNLWLPTNKGLIKVRTRDLQDYIVDNRVRPVFELFTEKDGFNSSEFNGGTNPSYALDGESIVLPTARGLIKFVPADFLKQNEPIAVPKMYRSGQLLSIPDSYRLLSGESFEMQFDELAGPNLFNNKIWYRLVPSETNWKVLSASERVTFDNLLPGEYRIEYIVRSPFGPGLKRPDFLSFSVEPKWYQTSIVYGLSVLAILLLIWLFFRIRLYYIHQQQLRLQEEIHSKTSELNQVNQELIKSNQELSQSMEIIGNQIKFKEKVLLVLLHDLKSPMRFVTSSLRSLFAELDASSPHKKLSGEIVTSLTRIYKFMEDFQNWVLQSEAGINKPEFVSINQILEGIFEFYQQPATVYGNRILVNSDDLVIKTYSFTLKTIIGNLVDNAVKNTRAGVINLIAYDTLSYINIEVTDNGEGMSSEVLERILHIIESREKITMPSMGSGVGYRLIGEFITAVNGLISVESSGGKGTKVVISIRK